MKRLPSTETVLEQINQLPNHQHKLMWNVNDTIKIIPEVVRRICLDPANFKCNQLH